MDQHLYKFLVLHGHLGIPQLGSFVVKKTATHFDEGSGLLHGPVAEIRFTEESVPGSEKLFFDFLANETGLDEITTIQQFHDYAYALRNNLQENGVAELKGVGKLVKEGEAVHFMPATDLSYLVQAVNAGDPVLIDEDDAGVKKDFWWFYAIILGILGLGALAYYYL
ncbi:MAG: hypothetical protein V4450_03500 [Bacteroidota bacterium]